MDSVRPSRLATLTTGVVPCRAQVRALAGWSSTSFPAEKSLRMTTMSTSPIVRRSARALLLDEQRRLVLVKRTKPGQPPYWTSPGGGIDDSTARAALMRELAEELGATAAIGDRVLLISSPADGGISVQEVFIARLRTLDEAARTGEEWTDVRRGDYEVVRVPIHQVDTIDLKPAVLRGFVLDNVDVLVAEADTLRWARTHKASC